MAKNGKNKETEESAGVLLKKLLILELYKMGLPQLEIGKRLKTDTHTVNDLLKGLKKMK